MSAQVVRLSSQLPNTASPSCFICPMHETRQILIPFSSASGDVRIAAVITFLCENLKKTLLHYFVLYFCGTNRSPEQYLIVGTSFQFHPVPPLSTDTRTHAYLATQHHVSLLRISVRRQHCQCLRVYF